MDFTGRWNLHRHWICNKFITDETEVPEFSLHIVVNENSSDEFDIGHCLIKVKVTG